MFIQQKKIRVGSRSSALAQVQVAEIFELLSKCVLHIEFDTYFYDTQGDKDKVTPLTENPKDDFFTDALDQALLNHEIDIAIHSAKDLPQNLNGGLNIFSLTASIDETDAFVGIAKLSDLKPGAKIGTSSHLREDEVKRINPYVKVVPIRGDIKERLALMKAGVYDGIIVAACALKRLKLEHEITEILPWETTALQGQLAVVGRRDDFELNKIFSSIDVRKKYGKVYLVGAGPGDPELITLKAIKVLQKVDQIYYDYLAPRELLNHAPQAEKIYVGKRKGEHTLSQLELSKMLKVNALAGKNIARLKGGDPLVFARGADEINYLQSYHIQVEIIPGISSATGIPASLGIPLTARGVSSSVAFISGHEGNELAESSCIEIPKVDTLVFLMGLTKLGAIVDSLIKNSWSRQTPVIVISKGTTQEERIILGTIEDIQKKVLDGNPLPPALIVVGQTVKFFKPRSLGNERILYLGTHPAKYKALGPIVHFPMIEIRAVALNEQQRKDLLTYATQCDLIILTSRFAVLNFIEILKQINYSLEQLVQKDFAVIGEETASQLKKSGIIPQIMAGVETSEGLFQNLKEKYSLTNKKVLFPRSSLPNPFLKIELEKLGAHVKEYVVYENVKPLKREIPQENINQIIFTSPSTVKNFLDDYGRIPSRWRILSKGPKTKKTLEDAGYKSEVLIYD